MKIKLDLEKVNSKLHWTTLYSEKILLAVIGTLTMLAAGMDIYKMVLTLNITLADLFCLLYTSPSPRDVSLSRMPSSA